MLKQAKEIFKLLSLAGSFCICLFSVAYAQMFEAQSAADFAEKRGDSYGKIIAKMFQKKEGEIVCGRSNNVCKEGEICLKVATPYSSTGYCYAPKEGEHIITWSSPIVEMYQATNYKNGVEERFDNRGNIPQNSYGSVHKYYNRSRNGSLSVKHMEAAKKYGIPLKKVQVCSSASGVKYGCRDVVAAPPTLEISEVSFFETTLTIKKGDIVKGNKNEECFTDITTGKKICAYITGGVATLEYAGDNSYEGCEVLPVKAYNLRGCFFCPLTRLIFGAGNVVTAGAFGTFASSLKIVISVVFFIWLALAVLQQVSTFTKQDAPKLLAAILKQAFKFSIAFLLLTYPGEIFGKFILPVLNSGVNMGTAIMDPVKVLTTDETNALIQQKSDEEIAYAAKNSAIMGDGFYNQRPGGPNSNEPTFYERLENYLSSLQTKLAYMQAIGTTLICVGSDELITTKWKTAKEGFRMMIIGVVITVFALLLTISFAFMFLDTILELAIIGTMLPLMIAGWPFKVTAQYASTGLKMLLNVFFVMFFLGFTISINFNLIDQSLSVSQEINSGTSVADKTQQAQSGFEAIAEAINEQNIEKLRKATDIGGIGFSLLVFSCLFGWKVIQQTPPLANKMSPGFSPGIAPKIGTMAASTVKSGVSKLTKPARSAMSEMWHDAGGVVGIVSSPVALVGELADAAGRGLNKGGHTGWGKVASGVGKVLKFPHKAAKFVHKTYKDNKAPK